jgi:parallel beta-helix repeat protein
MAWDRLKMHGVASTIMFVASTCYISSLHAAQVPGPSPALFNAPYYVCTANYYVATTGSDSNSGTSPSKAWRTLQHANDALPGSTAPGSCINVVPGAYNGVTISKGGNRAESRGYVVYRCTAIDACIVRGTAGEHNSEAFETRVNTQGTPPNYVMIDGFTMAGGNASSNGVGVSSWNGSNGPEVSAHHIWVLNSVITGFGQTGIGTATAEFYYFIHNRVENNSNLQCSYQGSGIALNVMHTVPGYAPTADDVRNPNPLLGPSWAVGRAFFHNVLEWNIVANNALTHCGTESHPTDTDGNGIIFDSNLTGNGDTENYTAPSLVAFNLVLNNGGGGIHLFFSAYVTVANNSCYNNEIDPGNSGTGRPCMDDSSGYADTFINNIAVAVPVGYTSPSKCWNPSSPPYTKYNFAILGSPATGAPTDVFSHNVTRVVGPTCNGSDVSAYNGDVYSCSNGANRCATDPNWVGVANKSRGSENVPPVGVNFALHPGSAAISYGLSEPYLPSQSVDAGACSHALPGCF